jgi:hypothetical protein
VTGRDPRFAGDMSDQSLRDAFMILAVERATGLLTIHGPDGRTRWGFWSKGGVVGWRTDPVEESEVLGVLLYRANQLTKEQLARSLEVMEERGCRQGEALIELGWLPQPLGFSFKEDKPHFAHCDLQARLHRKGVNLSLDFVAKAVFGDSALAGFVVDHDHSVAAWVVVDPVNSAKQLPVAANHDLRPILKCSRHRCLEVGCLCNSPK